MGAMPLDERSIIRASGAAKIRNRNRIASHQCGRGHGREFSPEVAAEQPEAAPRKGSCWWSGRALLRSRAAGAWKSRRRAGRCRRIVAGLKHAVTGNDDHKGIASERLG